MFALVYFPSSKTTDVVCQSGFKTKFQMNKCLTVTYNTKPYKGKVCDSTLTTFIVFLQILFVGTRSMCATNQKRVLEGGQLSIADKKSKRNSNLDPKDNLPTMTIVKL